MYQMKGATSMKKIIIYRSFDGEDFYDEQTCEEYEQKYLEYGREFAVAYDFYLGNWEHLDIDKVNIDEMLCNLDFAFQNCEYVRVHFIPSIEAQDFMYGEFGFNLPEKKGTFKYDHDTDEWVEVDE